MSDLLNSARREWHQAKLQIDDLVDLYDRSSGAVGDKAKRAAKSVNRLFRGLPDGREEIVDLVGDLVDFKMSLTDMLEENAADFDTEARMAVSNHPFFRRVKKTIGLLNQAVDELRKG